MDRTVRAFASYQLETASIKAEAPTTENLRIA
jgi:hypothetical protein